MQQKWNYIDDNWALTCNGMCVFVVCMRLSISVVIDRSEISGCNGNYLFKCWRWPWSAVGQLMELARLNGLIDWCVCTSALSKHGEFLEHSHHFGIRFKWVSQWLACDDAPLNWATFRLWIFSLAAELESVTQFAFVMICQFSMQLTNFIYICF